LLHVERCIQRAAEQSLAADGAIVCFSNIQPGNAASIALVKRAGFVREGFSRRYLKVGGRWRDHERWAIVAEEWKSKPTKKIGVVGKLLL
jgi:RimJ/RimL family protein N-acetyltransferase